MFMHVIIAIIITTHEPVSRESVSWSVVRRSLSWSVSLEVISQFNSILLLSCYSLRSAGPGRKKTRQQPYILSPHWRE